MVMSTRLATISTCSYLRTLLSSITSSITPYTDMSSPVIMSPSKMFFTERSCIYSQVLCMFICIFSTGNSFYHIVFLFTNFSL